MAVKSTKPAAGPPPKEALAFFERKKLKVGFSYRDVWKQEHNTAFTVARMTEKALLADVKASLEKALAEGTPFEAWAEEIRPTFEESGWASNKSEDEIPSKLKTVYQTNARMARAVGQWERIQRTKKALPFLEYNLGPSKEHRAEHEAWAGLVLPADHSFWQDHMPPSAWGCKCWVRQVTQREADEVGVSDDPEVEYEEWENDKTGETELVPVGVDPAFNYPKDATVRQAKLDEVAQSELRAQRGRPALLGDKAGHEFHGNQYVGGGVAVKAEVRQLSDSEKRVAEENLARLPDRVYTDEERSHGFGARGGDVDADKVFDKPSTGVVFGLSGTGNKWVTMEVEISALEPTQAHIPREGLRSYINEMPAKRDGQRGAYLPEVVRKDGRSYIVSGHTRLGAQKLAGRKTAVVKVIDYSARGFTKPVTQSTSGVKI